MKPITDWQLQEIAAGASWDADQITCVRWTWLAFTETPKNRTAIEVAIAWLQVAFNPDSAADIADSVSRMAEMEADAKARAGA